MSTAQINVGKLQNSKKLDPFTLQCKTSHLEHTISSCIQNRFQSMNLVIICCLTIQSIIIYPWSPIFSSIAVTLALTFSFSMFALQLKYHFLDLYSNSFRKSVIYLSIILIAELYLIILYCILEQLSTDRFFLYFGITLLITTNLGYLPFRFYILLTFILFLQLNFWSFGTLFFNLKDVNTENVEYSDEGVLTLPQILFANICFLFFMISNGSKMYYFEKRMRLQLLMICECKELHLTFDELKEENIDSTLSKLSTINHYFRNDEQLNVVSDVNESKSPISELEYFSKKAENEMCEEKSEENENGFENSYDLNLEEQKSESVEHEHGKSYLSWDFDLSYFASDENITPLSVMEEEAHIEELNAISNVNSSKQSGGSSHL